jgi:hypothetical protein
VTFTWNVPGETAEPAVVVRADASPGDVARAAAHLTAMALNAALDAMNATGHPTPDQDLCHLIADDEGVSLVIDDPDQPDYGAAARAAAPALKALGIGAVLEIAIRAHDVGALADQAARTRVPGVDSPL